jgi:hypothetical protein
MEDDRPYVIESPTRIKLGPEAKYWAGQHGLSIEELARYLLQQDRLREQGVEVDWQSEPANAEVTSYNFPEDQHPNPNYASNASLQELQSLTGAAPSPAPNQVNPQEQISRLATALGVPLE